MKLRTKIRQVGSKIIGLTTPFPLKDLILRAVMEHKTHIANKGFDAYFVSPNRIAKYRVKTFWTKEPDTLNWIDEMSPGSVFWDIGANIGLYSVYAAKRVAAQVVAFEPSVFNVELLARNISLNCLEANITLAPIALSDTTGVANFMLTSTDWAAALSAYGTDFDQHGEKLNHIFRYSTIGLAMDDISRYFSLPIPNYIKIDVDGIEHLILKGGPKILSQVRELLVEINDRFEQQSTEAQEHLKNAGLTLHKKFKINSHGQYNQLWIRKG